MMVASKLHICLNMMNFFDFKLLIGCRSDYIQSCDVNEFS